MPQIHILQEPLVITLASISNGAYKVDVYVHTVLKDFRVTTEENGASHISHMKVSLV